jgi:C-terminal processing protease CtpA/Prc
MLTLLSKTKSTLLSGSHWFTLGLFVVALGLPADAQDQVSFIDNWIKVFDGSANLSLTLQKARLAKDLPAALENLPAKLHGSGIEVSRVTPGFQVRLGAKMVPVEGQLWWEHFEGAKQRPFVDVIEFKDEASAKRAYDRRWPITCGGSFANYSIFVTLNAENGLDAVSVITLRGRYLFNFGMGIPFRVTVNFQQNGTPEELKYIRDTSDWLPRIMEAVARDVIDPSYVTWIPPANLTDEDRKIQRMAAFARLWSEVKYNFVYLDRRPDLDWDSMLEVYLPRVAAARTPEEYDRVLEEAIALLKDGHTKVYPWVSQDSVGLNLKPIEGRPVVTDVADTPEMRSTGVTPGMELAAVNGVPVDQILKEKIYPYVAASSPQGREDAACWQLLMGETGGKLSATFRDLQGKTRTVELSCDLSDHRGAAKWLRRPPVEFRPLANGIAYVALNNFGNDEVPKQFDAHFDDILNSKGLILDVRENGGGSDYNGYAIIARLIDKPITQALKSLSRVYKPYYRSTGKPEEWDVMYGGPIQPRGERPFLGPVVVLVGSRTASAAEDFLVPLKATKRATLIGTPAGGSTGNPLLVKLYKADLRICTLWCRFPDDTEFVGVGVQPDILVQQTRRDVAEGRDPALEKAVAFLTGK